MHTGGIAVAFIDNSFPFVVAGWFVSVDNTKVLDLFLMENKDVRNIV